MQPSLRAREPGTHSGAGWPGLAGAWRGVGGKSEGPGLPMAEPHTSAGTPCPQSATEGIRQGGGSWFPRGRVQVNSRELSKGCRGGPAGKRHGTKCHRSGCCDTGTVDGRLEQQTFLARGSGVREAPGQGAGSWVSGEDHVPVRSWTSQRPSTVERMRCFYEGANPIQEGSTLVA